MTACAARALCPVMAMKRPTRRSPGTGRMVHIADLPGGAGHGMLGCLRNPRARSRKAPEFGAENCSNFRLLGDCQRIVDFDAKISDCTLEFAVAERSRVIMHVLLTH
jgi:hypothetical protein